MKYVYRHRLTVPREAVDVHGHVNNVHYVQWMQDAAVSRSENAGCTRLTESFGATWVVRMHRIEYLRPAYADDQVDVLTWVSNFRKVRSLRKYRFLRVSDGAVLAEGETDWVFVDAESARPRVIPDDVRACLKAVPEEKSLDVPNIRRQRAGLYNCKTEKKIISGRYRCIKQREG